MRQFAILVIGFTLLLGTGSAVWAVVLQDVYDAAEAGEGYDKLLVLDPEVTYTGGLTVSRGTRSCVHGRGAVINLENKSVWVAGYQTSLDIDHCILRNGYSGIYASEDAGLTARNNTIVACGYGITSWMPGIGVVIENNIIVDNLVYGVYCREYFEPFLQYNTVWGNHEGNYIKSCG